MKDFIEESNFPIKVLLNGQEFIHYSSFNVKRSITNFIDTFTITCNNPFGRYSTSIPIWGVVSIWYNGVEIFRGYIEKKDTNLQNVWSFMVLSGREEVVSICETDVDPQTAQFKNTTDNAIITKLLQWKGFTLDLGTAYPVKEYSANPWMRIAQVIDDVTKYSDCVVIKKWPTLVKRRLPTWPTWKAIPLRVTKVDWNLSIYNSKIIDIRFSENITQAKGYMMGYSYERGKNKKSVYAKTENKVLTSGDYAKKLRNQSSLKGTPLKYESWFSSTAKEKAEADVQARRTQRETDIDIDVVVTLAWFFDANIFDTVDVFIEQEKIQQYMYIEGIEYSFDRNNKAITILTIKPYPSV